MSSLTAYLPIDRYQSLLKGVSLPDHTLGAALFADISGFTPLTEALYNELGARRGGEELTRQLNAVYEALIYQVHSYRGSVVGFAGDAIIGWFEGAENLAVHRALTVALAMQKEMQRFTTITSPGGNGLKLALKIAVSCGPARRLVAGDPQIQLLDVLAGATVNRLSTAGQLAGQGEIVVAPEVLSVLPQYLITGTHHELEAYSETFAVVEGLTEPAAPAPWPELPSQAPPQLDAWLLKEVQRRVETGLDDFLTELRPTVALFGRFPDLDYDLDPEAGSKLDKFVRWVQAVISGYEGTLLSVTFGDKGSYLYASFGAPVAHQDDARRAVKVAQALLSPPSELSWVAGMQLGISQGVMRAGAYGSQDCQTYGVLGHEVNLAARMMELARPGQVLVSSRVQTAAGAGFSWQSLPPLRVKGRAEELKIYQLAAPAPGLKARTEPAYKLPMVGRGPELARVEEKLKLALAGQGQLVGLSGEAGLGKSRLAAEVSRLAANYGLVRYGGECQSYGTTSPYLVWQPIWQALFGLDIEQPVELQLAGLEKRLGELDSELVPRLPLLSVVLNLPIPDNDVTRGLEARVRKNLVESLLVDCLRACTKPENNNPPLLLVLEDCHWLDPLSADLLKVIGRAILNLNLPVLLVLTYRPPEDDRALVKGISDLSNFSEIRLEALSQEQMLELIRLKLAQLEPNSNQPLVVELENRLMERAEGNPFYLEELLNYLKDQDILHQGSEALARVELPENLYSLVLSRIDRLGENDRVVLKLASIIGRVFKAEWIWKAFPRVKLGEDGEVKQSLTRLARLDITPVDKPEPEMEYLFKHAITQQVTYESQPLAAREILHEQLGHFIEDNYHEELERWLNLLAFHYEHSHNSTKQREYFSRVARQAQATYANQVALNYYEKLLNLVPDLEKVDILLEMVRILALVGRYEKAKERAEQAVELADRLNDTQKQARSYHLLGYAEERLGYFPESMEWLQKARHKWNQLVGVADADEVQQGIIRVLIRSGRVYQLLGKYAEAKAVLYEALRYGREKQDWYNVADTLNSLENIRWTEGDFDPTRSFSVESLEIWRRLGVLWGIAGSLLQLGQLATENRDYAEAKKCYQESLALYRQSGYKHGIASVLSSLGMLAIAQEDYPASESYFLESRTLQQEAGYSTGQAYTLNNYATMEYRRGNYPKARLLQRQSLEIEWRLKDRYGIAYNFTGQAAVAAGFSRTRPSGENPNQEELMWAARWCGVTTVLLRDLGAALERLYQEVYDEASEHARSGLGEEAFTKAFEEGQAMPLEEAVNHSLAMSSGF